MLKGLAPDVDLETGRHGANDWVTSVHCPFHGSDRNGSAAWNPIKQRFRCHTCGISGDGYDVIQQVEGSDFATARARAADLCDGVFIEVADDSVRGRPSKLAGRRDGGRAKLVRSKYGRRKL